MSKFDMRLVRKAILKRLEHINLSSWHALKFVDQGLGFFEQDFFAARRAPPNFKAPWDKEKNPHPCWIIDGCFSLFVYQLWRVPSSKISVQDVLALALAAGRGYIKPACQRHEAIWLNHMLSLMLLCSLKKDDSELIRFSKWFRIKNLQPIGTQEQIAHQPILYYVADLFRTEKFESYEPLKECQAHFRVKDPPALVAALDGIHFTGRTTKT
jgi:hypothetical protein